MNRLLFVCILFGCTIPLLGQNIAVKNNVLYDLTLTPNLGIEMKLSDKSTLDISGGYNPFSLGEYRRFKHWLVQPEYRYWLCERFNGIYLGVHAHGGEFSVGGLDLPFGFLSQLEDHKYEGYFIGGGVSIGRQWVLNSRWSLEASLGLGYARFEYDKYPCAECGDKIKSGNYNYWGPTKAAISFIYFIK